jgi:hypothetical protein
MRNYHGILVDVSQIDKTIFNKLKVLGQKKDGGWVLYRIEVEKEGLEELIRELQKNMVKGFYFHLYKDKELIVVFKDRVIKTKTDKSTWSEIILYGKSQGIPKEQLDFFPCQIEDETY